MQSLTMPRSIKQLKGMVKTETLRFDYPIQRKGGQWNKSKASLLIHSAASDYPIPYIISILDLQKIDNKTKNVYYIIDGQQRIGYFNDFLDDGFRLTKDTPDVYISSLDQKFKIADKKFSELDPELQHEIETRRLNMIALSDISEQEITTIFERLNNGEPLTKHQINRAVLGVTLVKKLDTLCNTEFISDIAGFSTRQIKHSEELTAILQVIMILQNFDFKSFATNEVTRYCQYLHQNPDIDNSITKIQNAFNYLSVAFGNTKQKFLLKKINFPMLIVQAIKAQDQNIDAFEFGNWAKNFKDKSRNDDFLYRQFCGVGTTKRAKVQGRLQSMNEDFEKYFKLS